MEVVKEDLQIITEKIVQEITTKGRGKGLEEITFQIRELRKSSKVNSLVKV